MSFVCAPPSYVIQLSLPNRTTPPQPAHCMEATKASRSAVFGGVRPTGLAIACRLSWCIGRCFIGEVEREELAFR